MNSVARRVHNPPIGRILLFAWFLTNQVSGAARVQLMAELKLQMHESSHWNEGPGWVCREQGTSPLQMFSNHRTIISWRALMGYTCGRPTSKPPQNSCTFVSLTSRLPPGSGQMYRNIFLKTRPVLPHAVILTVEYLIHLKDVIIWCRRFRNVECCWKKNSKKFTCSHCVKVFITYCNYNLLI